MTNPDLFLHSLRQRLERRQGRALTVRVSTLARQFAAAGPSGVHSRAIRKHLAQVGITMRRPASGAGQVQLTLSPVRTNGPGAERDPLEHAVAATVLIITGFGNGSGFVVDTRGLFVTGQHVVADRKGQLLKRVTALFADGREAAAVLFRAHPVLDYALGWLEGHAWPTVHLGDPSAIRYGQTVFAVGSPASALPAISGQEPVFRYTVSKGVVSHPCQPLDGIDWIQTDAAIDHGDSGGPLVDERGAVLGISLRHHEDVHASGLALPVDYLTDAIAEAVRLGREACLAGTVCRWCGDWRATRERPFCRNCGARYL